MVTAKDIIEEPMDPIRMIVGDVLPAGLILIAGDPKAGKTLLMQDLALSVSMGEPAWGSLHVDHGDALYIANEGGLRSFRDRLIKMLDLPEDFSAETFPEEASSVTDRLSITQSSEPLGERLEVQLGWWLAEANDPRLIVIDTFSSVAPEAKGINRHQDDYNALSGLADLATHWPDTLFVVIHHTRKADGGDPMDKISGSNGLSAATDGMGVLRRRTASRQCLLSVRPRNAEESELVLERQDNLRWKILGDDEQSQLGEGRRKILDYLRGRSTPASPKEIATGIEAESANAVRKTLGEMVSDRQVALVSRGLYRSAAA
jgi:RecA-family ATPase